MIDIAAAAATEVDCKERWGCWWCWPITEGRATAELMTEEKKWWCWSWSIAEKREEMLVTIEKSRCCCRWSIKKGQRRMMKLLPREETENEGDADDAGFYPRERRRIGVKWQQWREEVGWWSWSRRVIHIEKKEKSSTREKGSCIVPFKAKNLGKSNNNNKIYIYIYIYKLYPKII